MATSLVAGRVDDDIKEKADSVIKRAGLSTSEVIRTVWENIAVTGEIPKAATTDGSGNPLMERLMKLRKSVPESDDLVGLTPKMLKEELYDRD